ncbi:predicted protein, partial [Thalassiosira pseudonana CCMP1335]
QTLPHGHLDYVLDMAFDYYGRRFATASGDRTVRVWDLNGDGTTNEWQAHRGAVHRISWAHPEFGQLLATAGAGEYATSRWVNKATLSDARRAVTTVEFAPRHLGLRLASGSADGVVRIYEALDTMNLNHWKLDGRNSGLDGNVSSNENMGVSSLSWCTGRFEPPTLVTGFSSGRVSIYRYDDGQRSWLEYIRLPSHATASGVPRGVLDVAWAPNVGRSYHLIASCGKDNQLKVHRVKRGRGNKGDAEGASSSSLVYEGTEVLDRTQAWRIQWNVTGTVLASSGDGGVVKLWKSDFQGRWKCVSEI